MNFINFIDYSGGDSVKTNVIQDRVQNEFSWSGGSCVELDRLIKLIRDKAVSERIKPSPYNYGLRKGINVSEDNYIQALIDQKAKLELLFASSDCSDRIETLRQNEAGVLITKTSIDQEKKVLGTSKKEENIYIGVGALILLVGLFIVIRK